MKCPQCQIELEISEVLGIEMDVCPACSGIWFDRLEVDKILELDRMKQESTGQSPHREHGSVEDQEKHHGRHIKHRKKTILGELFG